jgi:beta-galactosidase/beta-glucuronidase
MRIRFAARVFTGLFALALVASNGFSAEWQPAHGPLATRWAKDVSPTNALPEYPRPQMVRKDWQNLNGLWDYAIRPKPEDRPEKFDGQILVPYPVESALSGVMKHVDPADRVWYRRKFTIPKDWAGKNVLLHFGAVNWEANVWVNGTKLGDHRGGYDGFSFDLTDSLKSDGDQEIIVSAWNPIDSGTQPRGKQVRKPGGIFYTASTGIWQTVWLEPVPKTAIDSITIVPDIDKKLVRVTVKSHGDLSRKQIFLSLKHASLARNSTNVESLDEQIDELKGWRPGLGVRKPRTTEIIDLPVDDIPLPLWSPDAPYLYGLSVTIDAHGTIDDTVESYFAMRKISLGKDDKGITRIFLNNKPQFMVGPLDQGFWPDGIYTAPTDAALKYDIEVTRKLGFNMARKHVKVEPDRWYY